MKIASWNVNSIRARREHVLTWLDANAPDVLGLQEIKVETAGFPLTDFDALGYHAVIEGQKTYNGVALLSREPPDDPARGLRDFEDEQKRLVAATYGDVRVINVYVPNGQSVGSDKYRYKLDWLDALAGHVAAELERYPKLVLLGDFNITPDDRDVHDPDEWREQILCSTAERGKLRQLLDLGLTDAFRLFDQPEKSFSWWDYRAAAFRRNRGLRIDLILCSAPLAGRCQAITIDKAPRKLEKPSDHAPVVGLF